MYLSVCWRVIVWEVQDKKQRENMKRRKVSNMSKREIHRCWTYVADLVLCFLDSLQLWCIRHNAEALSFVLLKFLLVEHLQHKHTQNLVTNIQLIIIVHYVFNRFPPFTPAYMKFSQWIIITFAIFHFPQGTKALKLL